MSVAGISLAGVDNDATGVSQVAIIDGNVTGSSSALASFYAIMVTVAGQATIDNLAQKDLVNKINNAATADAINNFLNGATSTEDLLSRLDSLKDLGINSAGLESFHDKVKNGYEEYQNQEGIFNRQAKKAGKDQKKLEAQYSPGSVAESILSPLAAAGHAVAGAIFGLSAAKHSRKAERAGNEMIKADQGIQNSKNQMSTSLQEGMSSKSKDEAALEHLQSGVDGSMGFFNSITGG